MNKTKSCKPDVGISIQTDNLNQETTELNLVIQNATTGKEYVYTIALLNPEDKIIQFIPVTFKMK